MQIAKFNIIVMVDINGGMSKDGAPPKFLNSWTKYVKEKTIGNGNNAVIMGRNTYESFLPNGGFLPGRENYVISSRYEQQDYTNIIVYKDIVSCLTALTYQTNKKDDVWIIGGERLFRYCLKNLQSYCKQVVVCKLNNECYDCDQMFPLDELNRIIERSNIHTSTRKESRITKQNDIISESTKNPRIEHKNTDYTIFIYKIDVSHQEDAYLDMLFDIINNGYKYFMYDKEKDSNIEYRKLTNRILKFDISSEFPIITSFFQNTKDIIDIFIDDMTNLDFSNDSIGFRIRCNKKFSGMKNYPSDTRSSEEVNKVVEESDQIIDLIDNLTKYNQAMIYLDRQSSTNDVNNIPSYIKFDISPSKKYLHTSVACKDMEMFKNFPQYLIYISLLSYVIAYLTAKIPKDLVFFFSNTTIKNDHFQFVKKICDNDPKPFPTLELKNLSNINSLNDIRQENFEIKNYSSWIKFDKKIMS